MDINDERRTELLWRKIVDLRSQEACDPLGGISLAVDCVELSDLQALAEYTADALNADVPQGRAAARERLIQCIRDIPAAATRAETSPRQRGRMRVNDRALLALALLLLAAAVAIAAYNWGSIAGDKCAEPAAGQTRKKAIRFTRSLELDRSL